MGTRNWIEDELRRQMKPTQAPESLGRKVFAQPSQPRRPFAWVIWPAVAASVLLVSSEVRYHAEKPTVTRPQARSLSVKAGREVCLQCHTDKL